MQLTWKKVKVDRHWHIMCDYQYYSVPFGLIGQQLTVRMTEVGQYL
ncbi:Mu transposase domain-containing protein [Corynebacterium kozikiae]